MNMQTSTKTRDVARGTGEKPQMGRMAVHTMVFDRALQQIGKPVSDKLPVPNFSILDLIRTPKEKEQKRLNESLIDAAGAGNKSEVKRILTAGASANAQNEYPLMSAMMLAALAGQDEIVVMLAEAGAELNTITPHGKGKDLDFILIKTGDANSEDLLAHREGEGQTALDYVLNYCKRETAYYLRSRGAKEGFELDTPDIRNLPETQGRLAELLVSTIHESNNSRSCDLKHENAQEVKRLLKAGADPNTKDAEGTPVLLLAADAGDGEVVRLLLDADVDVNAKDARGSTALAELHACLQDEFVPVLIDAGVENVNATDRRGKTPLMKVAYFGRADLVQLLIDAGANVDATDNRGGTALGETYDSPEKMSGKHETRELLESHGAK